MTKMRRLPTYIIVEEKKMSRKCSLQNKNFAKIQNLLIFPDKRDEIIKELANPQCSSAVSSEQCTHGRFVICYVHST